MWNPKNYRLHLDSWGLGLFVMIMLPNFIWLAIPAPRDILRSGTLTPTLDLVSSIVQIFMVCFLCLFVNRQSHPAVEQKAMLGICFSVTLYLFGWIFYYIGFTGPMVILVLSLSPCLSFLFYTWSRKNGPAFVAAALFAVLHTLRSILNFL